MHPNAAITGWGHYLPERILSNQDLEKMVATSDEWIRTRTGIQERRVAGPSETTSVMCTRAARLALDRAGLFAQDIDLIICATTTPDHLLPGTGCLVQRKLGADNAGAFDLNSACTGFLYALSVASQFIQAGTSRRVLVVAGETLSRFMNYQDRTTCVLFGDGAAAVVLEATEQQAGVLSTVLGARGDAEHILAIEAGGSARPASPDTVAAGEHFVRMQGNEIFKTAIRAMAQSSRQAVQRAGLSMSDIHRVVPHQANSRIIVATQQALKLDDSKLVVNVERYGNTGSTSVPIALAEFLDTGPIHAGDNLLMVAFGGGLTWAAAVVRWADIAQIQGQRATPLAA
ncbi:MAG: ketoacyl-ACP synthase III [Planctomycetes bacterium]|nr:ketoacyl-ACP synthase III [Planctomycetota bacterium]